jgi:two-component system chemotaxis response regulator CheB
MAKKNIVVIGGSSGSFEVFKRIARGLPMELRAAIFIVWHMSPDVNGILPDVLCNAGPLPATEAVDGEEIKVGNIYVARPDHHLLLENSRLRVTRGPRENRFRPAIDPLFRSAAYEFGPRVVGIITSGALDDGTSGLWAVKQHGGTAVVQDPMDAEIASMPESAIRENSVDHIVAADQIADLIIKLSEEEISQPPEASMKRKDDRIRDEVRVAAEESALELGVYDLDSLTPFTCPECSGVLAKLRDGDRVRFRCHTGHAFSANSLLSSLTENIENSLWGAVRGIDESILLLNHIGDHFAELNDTRTAALFFQKASVAQRRNEMLRDVVLGNEVLTIESVENLTNEAQARESVS